MSSRSDQYAEDTYRDEEPRYEDETYETDEYGMDTDEDWRVDDEEAGWWRFWDEGIITLLVVGGAVLFLFPEPATSGVGILMMGAGVLLWLVDWMI